MLSTLHFKIGLMTEWMGKGRKEERKMEGRGGAVGGWKEERKAEYKHRRVCGLVGEQATPGPSTRPGTG